MLRCSVQVVCAGSAGKGFGDAGKQTRKGSKAAKEKQAGVASSDGKAVQRAVRLVEEQEARRGGGSGVRPVDPREAARGKVEYVKVKDWGSGQPEDLGSLQVDRDATRVFEAADSPGSAGSGDASSSAGGGGSQGMPFHETLARRLELLQSQGALGNLAQLPGGKPLPPFEQWAFALQHYEQYLADMYAVHAALEESLAAVADAEAAAAGAAGAAGGQGHQRLLSALELFGLEQGLARSTALLHDLQRLAQQEGSAQQAQQPAGGGAAQPLPPTQQAAAYASYVASLARLRGAAEGPEEEEQAVLRLLAHAYTVYLMHLTSGGRIAAAAVQKLQLPAIDALAFYRDYPLMPEGARPLERFVAAANSLGELLNAEQQEALMQELPKAMTKTSTLLVPLAREA
ncbi:heme oxygenase [Chlorella sorokiniana]|uniref:Heme oxygenase n=1 Tax=Chlorella sorokiniana TaxID=3076 RepID=A0A2P6U3B4_CHLSO|nr:heme oxygenase [Chlorella sorokiniana]|eukprot:PRW60809.1 heme oxygenase [Chlorella sorokiniana]